MFGLSLMSELCPWKGAEPQTAVSYLLSSHMNHGGSVPYPCTFDGCTSTKGENSSARSIRVSTGGCLSMRSSFLRSPLQRHIARSSIDKPYFMIVVIFPL